MSPSASWDQLRWLSPPAPPFACSAHAPTRPQKRHLHPHPAGLTAAGPTYGPPWTVAPWLGPGNIPRAPCPQTASQATATASSTACQQAWRAPTASCRCPPPLPLPGVVGCCTGAAAAAVRAAAAVATACFCAALTVPLMCGCSLHFCGPSINQCGEPICTTHLTAHLPACRCLCRCPAPRLLHHPLPCRGGGRLPTAARCQGPPPLCAVCPTWPSAHSPAHTQRSFGTVQVGGMAWMLWLGC